MRIAVCWKWVSLDRDHDVDERWAGVSAADEAALEVALSIRDRLGPDRADVSVTCLGPAGAEDVLRVALATGATSVGRIDASPELDSRTVASALYEHLADSDLVICGDYSIDRGSGSVPAFIAAELGRAQALGLVDIDLTSPGSGQFRVLRRLDGGRREVLDVPLPAVVSVEGSVAQLRRAPLAASLAVRTTVIPTVIGPHGRPADAEIHRARPRPRTLRPPLGDALSRVRAILDVGAAESHAETVTLEPEAAAQRIVDQLREWGYLDSSADAAVDASR